jgi:hypothetical protein
MLQNKKDTLNLPSDVKENVEAEASSNEKTSSSAGKLSSMSK